MDHPVLGTTFHYQTTLEVMSADLFPFYKQRQMSQFGKHPGISASGLRPPNANGPSNPTRRVTPPGRPSLPCSPWHHSFWAMHVGLHRITLRLGRDGSYNAPDAEYVPT